MATPDLPNRDQPDSLDHAAARPSGPLGQRRAFLVNRRYQLKASLLTATVALVLLVFVNLALYSASMKSSAQILADAPALEKVIRSQDRVELVLILLASLVFLVGVFVVTILETHRTAGAAHNIEQRMNDLALGRLATSLTLRRGDNLQELELAFNEMARSFRERAWEDVETLEQLAADAESIDSASAAELAGSIRRLALNRRSLVE